MKLKIIFTTIFIYFLFQINAQSLTDSIKWITLEKASETFTERQKPIFVYFYKNDCDSCREIEKTTFSNPEVANYINILFYLVKINVKTKDTIKFMDGKFYANPSGKIHNIARMMLGDTIKFPAFVIFSTQAKGQAFYGYKNRDEIFRSLIYYAEEIDRHVKYDDWYKYHKKGYPPGRKQIMTRLIIKWKALKEATELHKKQPRKMLLNFYNYNKISCTLMRTQSFNHPEIAKVLNEKFYPVNIDVYSQDTLSIMGHDYINDNKPYKYHQLPIAALEGKMTFPAYIILDEDGKVLEKFRMYQTPEMMEVILKYYGNDEFKKQNFVKFKKSFKSSIKEQ